MRGVCVALVLTLAPGIAAADAPAAIDTPPPTGELAKPVPDMAGKIWADLVTQLFPDITASAEADVTVATEMKNVRSIGIADDSWNFCGEKIGVKDFDAQVVRLGDQRR